MMFEKLENETASYIDKTIKCMEPYAVRIKNVSENQETVKLFDCNYLFYPELRNKFIFIDSPTPGVTYGEVCLDLWTSPARITKMYTCFNSLDTSGDSKKRASNIKIISKRGTGGSVIVPFFNDLDAHQFQNMVTQHEVNFELGPLSVIELEIPAMFQITFKFFPSSQAGLVHALRGNKVVHDFTFKTREYKYKDGQFDKILAGLAINNEDKSAVQSKDWVHKDANLQQAEEGLKGKLLLTPVDPVTPDDESHPLDGVDDDSKEKMPEDKKIVEKMLVKKSKRKGKVPKKKPVARKTVK